MKIRMVDGDGVRNEEYGAGCTSGGAVTAPLVCSHGGARRTRSVDLALLGLVLFAEEVGELLEPLASGLGFVHVVIAEIPFDLRLRLIVAQTAVCRADPHDALVQLIRRLIRKRDTHTAIPLTNRTWMCGRWRWREVGAHKSAHTDASARSDGDTPLTRQQSIPKSHRPADVVKRPGIIGEPAEGGYIRGEQPRTVEDSFS